MTLVFFIFQFGNLEETFAKKQFTDNGTALSTAVTKSGFDQFSQLSSLPEYLGGGVKAALGLVGIIFFVLMFYGGMRWFISRGEEDGITKGKETIVAAFIGLLIILSAYAVTDLVQTRLIKADKSSAGTDASAPGAAAGDGPIGCCIDAITDPGPGFNFVFVEYTTTKSNCSIRQAQDDVAGAEGSHWFWYQTNGDKRLCEYIFQECFDDSAGRVPVLAPILNPNVENKQQCAGQVIEAYATVASGG
ncbi:MAG: hypothetical protein COV59_04570 [Candidatus Magasanikbacteria bacterium CG11_big_fil_rev_8_21_14_0_20_39_34]|uniref:Uncharacterized protein n=1 Tax=Candidatus Magasanikbacteria bacterium CG11_big_fil_rev_8_21_14_0_20_39_34 TaxID=1974653 RepID=A0A2H0N494_9BACT|nr:MAG: hypothetical protein COV59_04570 [Candidatus Magasanikbacteria bacterium CG11_big_fil_rev_8_21_14_0_20_39_34]